MNINEAAEHLRRLAQNNPHRSKTGCLRELYVEIEAARKAGFTTEKIVDALNEKGLDISPGTFVTLLHRIRKQKGSKEPNPASQDGVSNSDEKKVAAQGAKNGGINFLDFTKPTQYKRVNKSESNK